MSAGTDTRRIVLCRLDDVPLGGVRRVSAAGLEPLAVVRVDDGAGGSVHVVSDTCTHEDESLSEGDLDGTVLVCIAHFAEFDVRDGRPLCFPAERPLTVYPATIEEGDVVIEVEQP
ncbi:MAG TPA: non-heme iron oxygenase ferredoxin subunit [Pseudonocardia sp.]